MGNRTYGLILLLPVGSTSGIVSKNCLCVSSLKSIVRPGSHSDFFYPDFAPTLLPNPRRQPLEFRIHSVGCKFHVKESKEWSILGANWKRANPRLKPQQNLKLNLLAVSENTLSECALKWNMLYIHTILLCGIYGVGAICFQKVAGSGFGVFSSLASLQDLNNFRKNTHYTNNITNLTKGKKKANAMKLKIIFFKTRFSKYCKIVVWTSP